MHRDNCALLGTLALIRISSFFDIRFSLNIFPNTFNAEISFDCALEDYLPLTFSKFASLDDLTLSSPNYFVELSSIIIVQRVRIIYQAIYASHNHGEIVLRSVVTHNIALFERLLF